MVGGEVVHFIIRIRKNQLDATYDLYQGVDEAQTLRQYRRDKFQVKRGTSDYSQIALYYYTNNRVHMVDTESDRDLS